MHPALCPTLGNAVNLTRRGRFLSPPIGTATRVRRIVGPHLLLFGRATEKITLDPPLAYKAF